MKDNVNYAKYMILAFYILNIIWAALFVFVQDLPVGVAIMFNILIFTAIPMNRENGKFQTIGWLSVVPLITWIACLTIAIVTNGFFESCAIVILNIFVFMTFIGFMATVDDAKAHSEIHHRACTFKEKLFLLPLYPDEEGITYGLLDAQNTYYFKTKSEDETQTYGISVGPERTTVYISEDVPHVDIFNENMYSIKSVDESKITYFKKFWRSPNPPEINKTQGSTREVCNIYLPEMAITVTRKHIS